MPPRDRFGPERRFLLATSPDEGTPELTPEDQRHAGTVLRLGVGDPLWGLDGRGSAWPLVVVEAGRRGLRVEVRGEALREPPPGRPGSPLPELVAAVALPRPTRVEPLVERLTQLGVARIVPLVTERSAGHAREAGEGRLQRWARTAREACKQCGRLWVPDLAPPTPLEEALEAENRGPRVLLDPGSPIRLAEWVQAQQPPAHAPWTLLVGPEGGFGPDELERARAAGVEGAWLGPHVLRLETAAELGVGLLAHLLTRPGGA